MKIPFTEIHIITRETLRHVYESGRKFGRIRTLIEIMTIVNNSEYPEDLEMNICEYLESTYEDGRLEN